MAEIFISYTSSDRDWAFWIGHELEALGHVPRIHEWELSGGGDIAAWMEERHDKADHVLCVNSKAYRTAPYSSWERHAAQWAAADQRPGFALPVRVDESSLSTLFAHIKRCDLFGVDEAEARARLIAFLTPAGKPSQRGPFPGGAARPPSSKPPPSVFPGRIGHAIAAPGTGDAGYFTAEPTMGHVSWMHLIDVPDAPDETVFRYRVPQSEVELEPFVELSDAEVVITDRHPDLYGCTRRRLYYRWFGFQRLSFLLLDRFDVGDHKWQPIAVSIVLPLTELGRKRVCNALIRIVDLAREDIADNVSLSSCFLVDTWITKQKGEARLTDRRTREPNLGYARAMLLVHLGLFWRDAGPNVLLVEADNIRIMSICDDIGFDATRRTADGEILQSLCYPDDIPPKDKKLFWDPAIATLRELRQWPVLGLARISHTIAA
jgi:TIR domain